MPSRPELRCVTPAEASPTAAEEGPFVPETPNTGPVELVSLADIERAADRVRDVVVRTPLLALGRPRAGDARGRTALYVKPENLQPIGAFKLRGAYNAIASLGPEVAARGVVAHSSGNHARGVSRAARLLGVRAVIVMPRDTVPLKVRGVEEDGAEIVWVGPSSDERAARAAELAARDGMELVASYDDPRIIAGQGTVGLEIVEQLREELGAGGDPALATSGTLSADRATVVVPVGGGGLASGIAVAIKSMLPAARVLGVEPELAADARDSLREGRIVRWEDELVARTSADGMRTSSLGQHTFAHLVRYLDGIVTVSEVEISRAMARAAREGRLVLEPSGATALAAALFHADDLPAGGPLVAVLSGGNVDPARYRELLAEGEAAGG